MFGGEFDFQIGSAVETKRALGIPARADAYPVRTLWTLTEIGFRFFDSRAESLVMRRALNGSFDLVCGTAGLP